MKSISRFKGAAVLSASLFIAACGGGSDTTTNGGSNNRAPTAAAGANQTVDELSAVTLDGSTSSDPDAGTTLTYSWSQTAGTTVALSSTTDSQPTFDAPDVAAVNTPDTLTFRLTVSDGSLSASDDVQITVNDIGVGVNSPPTASAGPDQTVVELTTIDLDGSASVDPDGDLFSFTWLQTGGPIVALSNVNAGQPGFLAPDVAAPTVLTFQLTVDDGAGSATDIVDITVQEGLSQVSISGFVKYQFVPANHNNRDRCFGLDFSRITSKPIRAATVQLLDSSNNILGTTVSGDDGSYSFDNIVANTDVRVRVRAELKRNGAPSWDVEVRDNVDPTANPALSGLKSRPLYVAQWDLFNTGGDHITGKDYVAKTGWDTMSSSYTSDIDRVAAPFAILDSIYMGMKLVLSVDPTATFAPLDAFWSVDNTKTEGSPTNIDMGELGGSFYQPDLDSLFLVGDAAVDTGEFDFYVTLHEWGHYFEDNFSRSNSIGGTHFIGGLVEARVSFGEGWGTGVGAMASGDPMACNTGAANGAGSWGFNVETFFDSYSFGPGPHGWYNELSVAALLLDLFDTNNDGVDNSSIGFGPIYDVMTGQQRTTEAFTTLFSFASLLRPNLTLAEQGFLDTLLSEENVETTGLDIWASSQGNINIAPNNSRDVLPLSTDYTANGSVLNICVNNDHDPDGDGNKPAEHRYLRVTTTSSGTYDVTIVANPIPPPTTDLAPTPPDVIRDRSDPDVNFYRNGRLILDSTTGVADSETFFTQLSSVDVYLLDLYEWRFEDPNASSDYPGQICFDVTMTAR